MKTVKFRNDTGGRLSIPLRGPSEHLEGAIGSWLHVEAGDTFKTDVDKDGVPVNPTLRVAFLAKERGIVKDGDPVKAVTPRKETRKRTITIDHSAEAEA